MADEIKEVKSEDVSEMTKEEIADAWSNWVRSEVNAALDIYLARAVEGNIGVKYGAHVVEETEAGKVYDDSKADSVMINILFNFEEPLDLNAPMVKEEPEEQE
jgi:hypothetical protein